MGATNEREFVLILFFQIIFQLSYASSHHYEINHLEEVVKYSKIQSNTHSIFQTLVVFDLDNTLLAYQQSIGSDQWFRWQYEHLNQPHFPFAVAQSFMGLLEVQGKLHALAAARPTQKNTSTLIRSLQNQGYPILILTSRGPRFYPYTMRHLTSIQVDLSQNAIPSSFPKNTFLPYQYSTLQKEGFSLKEIKNFHLLTSPRKVLYREGIFFSEGQHKGAMLKLFLNHAKKKLKSILFIDDHRHHCDGVAKALKNDPSLDVLTFRYGGEDHQVEMFNRGSKDQAIREWLKIKKLF
ncbi:MAG: hypothetical protein CL678_04690 [Bdellovibrionaceae bacterium]|nr:hypothetical protein [Pseudobdellovibrionaceae bacterium]|tara:strand:- start:1484 stop:2365 length:882 start_codon:yes stop_codon:yes gene_type:complete